jgi:hypothetical protein
MSVSFNCKPTPYHHHPNLSAISSQECSAVFVLREIFLTAWSCFCNHACLTPTCGCTLSKRLENLAQGCLILLASWFPCTQIQLALIWSELESVVFFFLAPVGFTCAGVCLCLGTHVCIPVLMHTLERVHLEMRGPPFVLFLGYQPFFPLG